MTRAYTGEESPLRPCGRTDGAPTAHRLAADHPESLIYQV
jgi:hypothetical protein